MIFDYIKSRFVRTPTATKSRVVILGGGWGGYYVAKGLLENAKKSWDVTMVTLSDEFLYTPLLATYGFGGLNKTSLAAKYNFPTGFNMIHGSAYQVKTNSKLVDLISSDGHQNTISYDKLIIAMGGSPATYGIPGVDKYAMTLKNFKDGQIINQKVRSILDERQKLSSPITKIDPLKFIFVGAGPTSLEMAGELNHLIKKRYPNIRDQIIINVLDVAGSILNSSPPKQRDGVIKAIEKRGIKLTYPIKISAILKKEIKTDTGAIPYTMLFWNAGINSNTLLIDGKKTSPRGLEIDDYLRLNDAQDVYAIGDCTRMLTPLPKTAQVAKQQANYLVSLLNNQSIKQFKYNHGGMIIPLDSTYSSAYMKIFGHDFVFNGIPGVIVNRLFTLSMLPTYSNVLSIMRDWTFSK